MPYETTCPKGHRLQVSDSHLGMRIQCPACNESFVAAERVRGAVPPTPASRGGWRISANAAPDLARLACWTGRPMVAVGLLLVLLSKGCDSINEHYAARTAAAAQAAAEQFDDDLRGRRDILEAEIKAFTSVPSVGEGLKGEEKKKLDDLRKQLAESDAQAAKDRASKESGEWHDLKTTARNARRTYNVNSYWHEIFFIFAAVVLLLGLLIVSWGAEGAERWVSLVMLAIITYSLFVTGLAWRPTIM